MPRPLLPTAELRVRSAATCVASVIYLFSRPKATNECIIFDIDQRNRRSRSCSRFGYPYFHSGSEAGCPRRV